MPQRCCGNTDEVIAAKPTSTPQPRLATCACRAQCAMRMPPTEMLHCAHGAVMDTKDIYKSCIARSAASHAQASQRAPRLAAGVTPRQAQAAHYGKGVARPSLPASHHGCVVCVCMLHAAAARHAMGSHQSSYLFIFLPRVVITTASRCAPAMPSARSSRRRRHCPRGPQACAEPSS